IAGMLWASMGPQPWELRKLGRKTPTSIRVPRFNGAAALGAAETRPGHGWADAGYVASMGPQPWELRKRPSLFALLKQPVASPFARAYLQSLGRTQPEYSQRPS